MRGWSSGGPGSAEAETFAEIIQAKGVGKGGAIAASLGGMVSLDDLIEHPAGDEEAEDTIVVGEAYEDGEDDEMDDALGILAVIHGADAGDEAEEGGEAGVGLTVVERRDGGAGAIGSGVGVGVTTGRGCVRGGTGSGQLGGKAGFAEDRRSNGSGALLAERFTAVLTK